MGEIVSGAAFAGWCAQNVAEADQAEYTRSRDWIARNLGDVPYRHTGGLWELVVTVGIDGPLPTRAPVESDA